MLSSGDLNAKCSQVCNQNPCTATTYTEAQAIVGQSKVDYVIEVNENYEPTGIFDSKSSPKLPPSTYCLLMAGGKGSRLRPLTLTRPKPLVGVGGQPMIDYTLKKLAREGVKEIFLCLLFERDVL